MSPWIAVAMLCWSLSPAGQQAPPPTTVAATGVQPLGRRADAALRARVLEWWGARERRDHARMYALFEPAYRKRVTFADFVKENAVRTRFDLADARVDEILPDSGERVRVKVNMETRPPNLPRGRVTAEDIWVRVSGKWFKVHQDPVSPFALPR
jgi:hypothetical protein